MEKLNINDSTDFYDNARSARNEKAQKRAGNLNKDSIDASGWEEPTMETERKTGGRPQPRAFKRGGKVEGEAGAKHAGRKPRASGGKIEDYLKVARKDAQRHELAADLNNSAGRLNAADQNDDILRKRKKGMKMAISKLAGSAKVPARASGGQVHPKACSCKMCSGGRALADGGKANYDGGTRPDGGRIAKASGGKLKNYINKAYPDMLKHEDKGINSVKEGDDKKASEHFSKSSSRSQGIKLAAKKLQEMKDRSSHKKGGKVKGKTNINIHINTAPKPAMDLPMGLPPGAMPPPAPNMGAGAPPMAPKPLPPGLGVPPPAMGAGPMPRASGGRATLDAGAGSGLGRLEKVEIQKRH